MSAKFHDFDTTINTWMTKFYFPIVISDLCPLHSTFSPLTLIPFVFQTSPFIITAPLCNAVSIKRLQYCVSTSEGKSMMHIGMFVFNHCEVIAEHVHGASQ